MLNRIVSPADNSTAPIKETEIDRITLDLGKQVSAMEDIAAILLSRIGPVLRTPVPNEDKASIGVAKMAPQTPLGGALSSFAYRLENLRDNVGEVLSRLEV